jgi:large subunit ribosomal protein L25
MEKIVLTAEKREGKGKGPARRLRVKGLIPAVVYGRRGAPSHLAVDPALLLKAIETPRRFNTLLTLDVAGEQRPVLFRDYQVDPVSRRLLHADFFEVQLDRPVTVEVPVETVGRAQGVTDGGILSVARHEILVEALPERIPVKIEVDVTALKIGQSIHIADLTAPEGCRFSFSANYTVAFVAVPEKEEVVAPVAAVPGAPVEGAAAAPVAGAAPGTPAAPAAAGAAPAAAAPAAKGGEKKK